MRGSRIELTLGTALLLLVAGAAAAQPGAPIQLLPPTPQPGTQPATGQAAPAAAGAGDIHATPLAPVDPSWIGTLGPADRALPHDMWSTTPRAFVDAALPLLQPTDSPTLQDLDRRLLLSDAAPPPGQDPANGPTLAAERLGRLLALGRVDGVQLIDLVPQNDVSEKFDRDAVEMRVAANDLAGACRMVEDRVARYRDAWWDEALVACQALNRAYDKAALGLSAMREQRIGRDPVFEALIDNILGHRRKLDRLPDPTPLRMTLLAAAKLPLPAAALAEAGPAALAVWATSDKVPVSARLAAGERAEALGALPPAALGLLYGTVESKASERTALLQSARLPDDPKSRAILFDIARTSEPGAQRVAALTLLLAGARQRGTFVTAARLAAPLIVELQPAPEFKAFAGDAARALLAARDLDAATPWIALAGTPELRLLADLARPPAGEDAPPLKQTVAALTARDATAAPHQAALLIALLTALGEASDQVDLAPLLGPPHDGTLPDAALWLDQKQAAAAGRIGETVLTSVLIAAAGEHLSSEPIVLARVVSGLKTVGLEADARALAVEAALDAGI